MLPLSRTSGRTDLRVLPAFGDSTLAVVPIIVLTAAGCLSALVWLALLADPARPWRLQPSDESEDAPPEPKAWPPVGVVIPARNEAGVLGSTLPSVLGQDYPGDWRIVVVDDRSTDGTRQLADALAAAQCSATAYRPSIIPTATLLPSAAPRSSASLTSPMPMPLGYASSATNRNRDASNAESTHSSALSGEECDLGNEHDDERREDDLVGQDLPLGVDGRENDEHCDEEGANECLARETEPQEARRDQEAGRELDERVADPDRLVT